MSSTVLHVRCMCHMSDTHLWTMGTVPTIKKLTYSWEKLKIIKLSQIKLCDKYNIRNKQDTVKKKSKCWNANTF
jgi:hypothetical protein